MIHSTDQAPSLPAQRQSERRFAFTLITILTIFSLAVHGFHPYAEDGGLYAAGIKLMLHPALYLHSRAFVGAHLRFSLFAPTMAMLVRASHLSLSTVLLGTYLVGIWTTLFAVWLLAKRCYRTQVACVGGVALTAAWLTLPVAGTSVILVDPYVTARSVSLPCALLALVSTIDLISAAGARRRIQHLLICSTLLLVAALAHPLMAAYAVSDVLLLALALSRRRGVRVWGVAALCGAAAAMAGVLRMFGQQEPAGYAQVAATRYYWFLTHWQWYELIGLAAPLAIVGAVAFSKESSNNSSRTDAVKQALATMAGASGTTAVLVSLAFVHESSATYLLARLQPLRTFQTVYVLMIIFVGAALGTWVLQRIPWRWIGVFTLLAGTMFFVQRSIYPASEHVEWRGTRPANLWMQAFLWIKDNTPPDALFALDGDYISIPGEDAQSFRAAAERSALPDFSKDGGEASITPALTALWHAGQTAQIGLSRKTDMQRLASLKPAGVGWIVLQTNASTRFNCPYRNDAVKVCRLP